MFLQLSPFSTFTFTSASRTTLVLSDHLIQDRHSLGLVNGRRIVITMAVFIARFSPAHINYSVVKQTLVVQEKARVVMLRDPCAISSDTLLPLSIRSVQMTVKT
ncbi:hypothetical protein BDR03DRAFT_961601 [Suillus americanus]|nr:hypothetical protein BDR03DRAFT_961601 [Suillus americanus]